MKPTHKTIIAVLIISVSVTLLQAQGHWDWATSFGGPQSEGGVGLTVTSQGSLLCTGYSMNESSFMVDTFIVGNHSPQNAFVCKYDNSGNLLRIATGTGTPNYMGNDDGVSIYPFVSVPGNGHYLSVVTCSKTVTVDTTHIYAGDITVGISTWDTNAHLIQLRPLALSGYPGGVPTVSALTYCNGSIYTTGGYSGVYADLDTIRLYNPDSAVFNSSKGYLAKMDTGGKFKMAKQITGGKVTRFIATARTTYNRLVFYADSDSCLFFDTMTLCKVTGSGIGAVFQSDTDGNILWYKSFYSESNGFGINSIFSDGNGDLYFLGSFNATLHFGADTFPKISPGWDIFLAKINSSGNLLWLRQFYSEQGFIIGSMPNKIISNTQFYLAGSFSGSMALCGDTITAEGSRDMFVARFDTSGGCIGIVTASNAVPGQFVEDSTGNVYITGSILDNGTAMFDDTELTSNGSSDFFLARLSAITSGTPRLLVNDYLTIYANPNAGNFTVQVPDELNGKRIQLGIYDNNGKTVKEERLTVENEKLAIALGEITKGIYNVVLSSGSKKYTGRVVVK